MINVYYNNKKIILHGFDGKIDNNLRNAKVSLSDVDKISEFLKSDEGEDIEIVFSDEKDSKPLCKILKCIVAAGGLVKNTENEYLFIFRRSKWDLPKGKVDPGETIKKTAIREVMEECGIGKIKIEKFIRCTYHIYPLKKTFVLKSTHWFLMTAAPGQKLIPQTEEDITEITWLPAEKIKNIYSNTFPSVLEVISEI
jgi:8-oxo-dGTP pyrophosphatase MutT (NUDIX family)